MEGRRKGGRKGGVGGWDEDEEDYDDEKNIKALNINDYTKKDQDRILWVSKRLVKFVFKSITKQS